jgi:hypothetical protein
MSPQASEMLMREVEPRIRSSAHSFVPIGSDDREEQCQDAVVTAAQLLHSVEARVKQGVSAGNVAYFAVKLVKQGRRSTGSKPDPLHPVAILSGRSQVVSLQEAVHYEEGNDEPLVLGEVLACEGERIQQQPVREIWIGRRSTPHSTNWGDRSCDVWRRADRCSK